MEVNMDNKALFNISYGIFLLATKDGEKLNGCITNTCMQVANNPTRIAMSVINNNLTCEMLKKSKVFALSILDKRVTFDTIKHFGLQSGRDVDKFKDVSYVKDLNGVPYLNDCSCSVFSCHVVSETDLGSHTMFIAEFDDAKVLSTEEPVTYSYYQNNIKPKPETIKKDRKIIGWRCKICNYVYDGPNIPADYLCPLCGHPVSDFEPIYE